MFYVGPMHIHCPRLLQIATHAQIKTYILYLFARNNTDSLRTIGGDVQDILFGLVFSYISINLIPRLSLSFSVNIWKKQQQSRVLIIFLVPSFQTKHQVLGVLVEYIVFQVSQTHCAKNLVFQNSRFSIKILDFSFKMLGISKICGKKVFHTLRLKSNVSYKNYCVYLFFFNSICTQTLLRE